MSAVLDDSIGFEEPILEEPTRPTTDRNAVAITQDMGRVQNSLSEFDRVAAGLAELEARYPKDAVYDVTSAKGMKDAIEHRAAWREPRIMVEKARKMAKAPLLALGKNVDARASWLTDKLREGEEPIDQLIKAEEARREEEKRARINAEMGRVLAIQEALAGIAVDVQIACSKSSADIQVLLDQMRATGPDQLVFQEQIEQARAAWAAGIGKLEIAHKAKLWDEEQEAMRTAAEAERKRQQEAEDAERARISAAQAAEAERLAAAAEEAKRKDEVQHVLSSLTWQVTHSFGKPASHVQEIIDLLNSTVYSESLGTEVLTAHEAALKQLRMLHTMAAQQEALAAQAAQVTAPAAEPQAPTVRELQEPVASVPVPPNTQSEKQDGYLPAAAGACARTEAEAAQASGGDEGKAAHAEERAAEPVADRSIETSEADAIEPAPGSVQVSPPAADEITLLLRDTLALVEFLRAPYSGRFPTQPKVGTEWWASLRTRLDAIQPRVVYALGIPAGEA